MSVAVAGRVATNNVETLTSAAKQGLGITVGATLSVGPALLSGELVRVLSDYEFEPTAIFAVYTSARQLSTKIRATVDFLADKLSDPAELGSTPARQGPGLPEVVSSAPRRCGQRETVSLYGRVSQVGGSPAPALATE